MSNQEPMGKYRQNLYNYLQANGMDMDASEHIYFRMLLKQYINAKTVDLQLRLQRRNMTINKMKHLIHLSDEAEARAEKEKWWLEGSPKRKHDKGD